MMKKNKETIKFAWTLLCLFLFALLFFLVYIWAFISIEFLHPQELNAWLLKDPDNYYSTFFEKDLQVRNSENTETYKKNLEKCVSYPTLLQKCKLYWAVFECNRFFKQQKEQYGEVIMGCVMDDLMQLPWTFGIIENEDYEGGLPHTRKHVIILQSNIINVYNHKQLTELCIHEKIHVYQKMYPDETQQYIDNHYEKVKKREEQDNIRANPDIDEWIYMDKTTGEILKCNYREDAKKIVDVVDSNQMREHPMEKMAVAFEKKYNEKK